MNYRIFGRTGWQVSEVGFGMWGMGGWSGSDDEESLASLELAVQEGCNFFDAAWIYGRGHSERLLGELLRRHPEQRLFSATKIPPRNLRWPSQRADTLADAFPESHVREYLEKSLVNLELSRVDLIQFHVWEDVWSEDPQWQRMVDAIKREGLAEAVGVSINRWEPWNALRTVRTGIVDVVQVVYNIFDQAPEDELFPACRDEGVAVIARVSFDEGTLTAV